MQRTAMSPSSVSCLLPVPIANRRLSDISCARLPVKCWPIATRTWDNPPAMFKLHRWIETTPHYSLVQQGVPASLSLAPPATRVQPLAAISTIQSPLRSEEHTSELQSLMRISYAVFCLKKQTTTKINKY